MQHSQMIFIHFINDIDISMHAKIYAGGILVLTDIGYRFVRCNFIHAVANNIIFICYYTF